MTDLTPNDLSHLSDEEFNALCPQGYHETGPAEPLSPAAQAVYDAVLEICPAPADEIASAALRAAADQVAPEPSGIDKESLSLAAIRNRCKVRDELFAIAAELEGNGND